MRVIFMGTPGIAADVLKTLNGKYEIVGVFCQPDKPVGRKQILTPPPVKEAALELGLPVYQPVSVRKKESIDLIRELAPDILAVVAYGKILPQEVLDIPRFGAVNLHGSLLPAYRGSAPIQRSIMDGQPVGMTAMCMGAECDAGDMLCSRELTMGPDDDAETVFDRMGKEGGEFLFDAIEGLVSGEITPVKQDETKVTFAPPLEKEEGRFDFSLDASCIVNRIKGMAIWPNADFLFQGKKVKVRKARYSPLQGEPGTVVCLKPFTVAAKDGSVELLRLIPEGSKEMNGEDWARGRRFAIGDKVE